MVGCEISVLFNESPLRGGERADGKKTLDCTVVQRYEYKLNLIYISSDIITKIIKVHVRALKTSRRKEAGPDSTVSNNEFSKE